MKCMPGYRLLRADWDGDGYGIWAIAHLRSFVCKRRCCYTFKKLTTTFENLEVGITELDTQKNCYGVY